MLIVLVLPGDNLLPVLVLLITVSNFPILESVWMSVKYFLFFLNEGIGKVLDGFLKTISFLLHYFFVTLSTHM